MKKFQKILKLTMLCACMGSFCAYGNATIKKSMKLTLSAVQPPQAKSVNTASASYSSSKTLWIQAEVKFDVDDIRNVVSRFIDDPVLEVSIATYPGKTKNKCVNFTGSVKYWTIEQNGKTHYMKALLPAPVFQRYAYGTSLDRDIIAAKVVLKDKSGTLGTAYGSTKSLALKELQRFFRALPKNTVKVPDTISGRAGTSWSVIEVNKYELEKIK